MSHINFFTKCSVSKSTKIIKYNYGDNEHKLCYECHQFVLDTEWVCRILGLELQYHQQYVSSRVVIVCDVLM